MAALKILFVTPEVEPFVKVGGLADMVGALPADLAALGHDVRVVCPAYGSVKRIGDWRALPEPLGVDVGTEAHWARTATTTGASPSSAAARSRSASSSTGSRTSSTATIGRPACCR